jgi:hypothetical protein
VRSFYLGLIETQGNQSFIYATNRERTARGASELLYASTTTWVREAVTGENIESMTLLERTKWITSRENNQWESDSATDAVTVVVATSGRAVLLSSDVERLRAVISHVTEKAIRQAPGLVIVGAIELIDNSEDDCFGAAQRRASQRLGANMARLPSLQHRFCQIPLVETCSLSGFPAQYSRIDRSQDLAISGVVHAQLTWAQASWVRFQDIVDSEKLADNVDQIPTSKSWRAVVHADGNGVGKVFVGMSKLLWKNENPYLDNLSRWICGYRDFSLALEKATESAFVIAARKVGPERVFPILLGGDDITVEVSGDCAREFTVSYLEAFEAHSESALDVLKKYGVTPEELPSKFTACAGVAIVKAHFPFHTAYGIASDLIDNAKNAKQQVGDDLIALSSFDVHVLYESSASDVDSIRQQLVSRDERKLWGGPYVVGDISTPYASNNDVQDLCDSIEKMGRSRQVNAIVEALLRGESEVRRTVDNTTATHAEQNLQNSIHLILDDRVPESRRSLLLDALSLLDVEEVSQW